MSHCPVCGAPVNEHGVSADYIERTEFFSILDGVRAQVAELFERHTARARIIDTAAQLLAQGACNGSTLLAVKMAREIHRHAREMETRDRAVLVAMREVTTKEIQK